MTDADPAGLNFMKLKKWLGAHGIPKEDIQACLDKSELVQLIPPEYLPTPPVAPAPAQTDYYVEPTKTAAAAEGGLGATDGTNLAVSLSH